MFGCQLLDQSLHLPSLRPPTEEPEHAEPPERLDRRVDPNPEHRASWVRSPGSSMIPDRTAS